MTQTTDSFITQAEALIESTKIRLETGRNPSGRQVYIADDEDRMRDLATALRSLLGEYKRLTTDIGSDKDVLRRILSRFDPADPARTVLAIKGNGFARPNHEAPTAEDMRSLIESHLREAVRLGVGWPKSEYEDRWIAERVTTMIAALEGEDQ